VEEGQAEEELAGRRISGYFPPSGRDSGFGGDGIGTKCGEVGGLTYPCLWGLSRPTVNQLTDSAPHSMSWAAASLKPGVVHRVRFIRGRLRQGEAGAAVLTSVEHPFEIVVDATELLVDPGREVSKGDDIEDRLQAVDAGLGAVALVTEEIAIHVEAVHGAVDTELFVDCATRLGAAETKIPTGGGECLAYKIAGKVLYDGVRPAEGTGKVQVKRAGAFKGITDSFGFAGGVGAQETLHQLHVAPGARAGACKGIPGPFGVADGAGAQEILDLLHVAPVEGRRTRGVRVQGISSDALGNLAGHDARHDPVAVLGERGIQSGVRKDGGRQGLHAVEIREHHGEDVQRQLEQWRVRHGKVKSRSKRLGDPELV